MNLYQVLNVKETASKSEIKSAYKSLIKKYHPDIYKGDKAFAERKTKEINTAFDTLSDPVKKAEYDASIAPKVNYNDYYSSYNSASSKYSPYGTSSRNKYSEPSKYSPYSNRRKQEQASQYKNSVKGSASTSYTERVIFNADDFRVFKNALNNKKTANLVIFGMLSMVFIIVFVILTTMSQLGNFYDSSNSYITRKKTYRSQILSECNNKHARPVYTNSAIEYYVSIGDTYSTVTSYLGKPDSEKYEYDYLILDYGNSFIILELNLDYEVIGYNDLGELVAYYD